MRMLGYPDLEPQDWLGASYLGGTTAAQLNQVIATRFSNPPAMTEAHPADIVQGARDWGLNRKLAITLMKCDSQAVLVTYQSGIYHWVIIVEDDGQNLTLWNPEWGQFETHGYQFLRSAYAGDCDVCERPIPPGGWDMLIQDPKGIVYVVGASGKRRITAAELSLWKAEGKQVHPIGQADVNEIAWASHTPTDAPY
jgi:hypothetical protein